MPYLRLIAQRLGMTVLTLWGLATLVFLIVDIVYFLLDPRISV